MGKNASQKQEVTEYRMSLHLGVAHRLDAITGLWVNEKKAWGGRSTTLENIIINQPDLFGGARREGGLGGTVVHLPGEEDQILPEYLANRYGLTSETCPAFRDLTTLFFVGGGPATMSSRFQILGEDIDLPVEQATQQGFIWSHNNPIIAQAIWIDAERAPKTPLDPQYAMIPNGEYGPDANPAHIIFECLVNDEWGMGTLAGTIDPVSFGYASMVLFNEGFGLSLQWANQTTIQDMVSEILDHIQATLYVNPRSGLWTLKLLRDDYLLENLKHVHPANAEMEGYSLRTWGEAVNEIAVTWTNPENEEGETVTYQNISVIGAQGGIIQQPRDYYGIRKRTLATEVAQRDVRSASAPLSSANVVVNRTFWDVVPGDIVLFTWPERNLHSVVMRVMSVDYGTSDNTEMRLSLLQDIFSLERAPIIAAPGTGWTQPGKPPEPMAATEILTLPAYMTASADFQGSAVDLEYPEVLAMVLGYQDAADAYTFDLLSEDTLSTGAQAFVSHGTKTVVERTILPAPMLREAESRLQAALVLNKQRGPEVGGFVFMGAGADNDVEVAHVVGYDDTAAEWILARGVLDTIPRYHPVGTPVWFVNPGDKIVDDRERRSAGEEVAYKLLPKTPVGVLPAADAPTVVETLTARPHLPLRPANVQVNGQAFSDISASVNPELHITWATRNRILEDGQVVRWTAGPVAPEHGQGTRITVYDQDNNNVYDEFGLWTATEKTLTTAWFNRYSWVMVVVGSNRFDLDSLQNYSFVVTDLPADPNAAPPPEPPDHGPPPNVDPAPAVGAWSATGVQFSLNEAGKVTGAIPAIVVSGKRDRRDAAGLIVRYRRSGSNDWFYLPEVVLDDNPTQTAASAVAPMTAYEVGVAYRSDKNVLSMWRDLGEVTTGAMIAQGIGDIGYQQVKDALDFLDDIDAEAIAALDNLAEIVAGINMNAEAILHHFLRNVEDRERFEKLTHEVDAEGNPVPIGTALREERETRISETEAFDAIFSAMGAWSDGNNAWILNGQTVWVNENQSLAQYQQALVTEFEGAHATIQSTALALSTATEAVAEELHAMGVGINGNTAFLIDQNKLLVTPSQSFAQRMAAITAQVDDASATVLSQAKTYVDQDSAFAQVLDTLNVTAGGFAGSITQLHEVNTAFGAKAGLRLDTNGHVTGYTAMNDGYEGGFVFVADYFIVASPSGGLRPFVIDGSKVQLNADVEINGNAMINGTLTAQKVVANNISETHRSFINHDVAIGASDVNLGEHVVALSGSPCDFDVWVNVRNTGGGAQGVQFYAQVLNSSGTLVYSSRRFGMEANERPYNSTTLTDRFTPPGPGVYTVRVWGVRPSGGSNIVKDGLMIMTEDKRTQA